MFSSLFGGTRGSVLLRAGLLIAAIALIDWRAVDEVPLGFLYLLPMLMVGRVLRPWQIATVAIICTILAEFFDAFEWNLRGGIPRDVLYFSSFFCVGLFVYEVTKSRPFQDGAHATGLGLYLSRAFVRSFGGELRYKPIFGSACFSVELSPVNTFERAS